MKTFQFCITPNSRNESDEIIYVKANSMSEAFDKVSQVVKIDINVTARELPDVEIATNSTTPTMVYSAVYSNNQNKEVLFAVSNIDDIRVIMKTDPMSLCEFTEKARILI